MHVTPVAVGIAMSLNQPHRQGPRKVGAAVDEDAGVVIEQADEAIEASNDDLPADTPIDRGSSDSAEVADADADRAAMAATSAAGGSAGTVSSDAIAAVQDELRLHGPHLGRRHPDPARAYTAVPDPPR